MKQTYIAETMKVGNMWYADNFHFKNHWAWGKTESESVDNLIMITGFEHRYIVD